MNWNEICIDSVKPNCSNPIRKHQAEEEIIAFVKENFGFDLKRERRIDGVACIDDLFDDFAERYNFEFNTDGYLIGHSEVTVKDRANELINFYDNMPYGRFDKKADALDTALDILREIAGIEKRPVFDSNSETYKWYVFYCRLLEIKYATPIKNLRIKGIDISPIKGKPSEEWAETYKNEVLNLETSLSMGCSVKIPQDIKDAVTKELMKESIFNAVLDFRKAYDNCEKLFSQYPGDINEIIADEYPFEKSFDEYYTDIEDWSYSVKKKCE